MNNQEIIDSLKCPINWNGITEQYEFASFLKIIWINKIRKYGVDKEDCYISGEFSDYDPDESMIEEMNKEERRNFENNIEHWGARATAEYMSEMRRFSEIVCCGPDVYDKHYVQTQMSDEEIRMKTIISDRSLLFPRVTRSMQTELMWIALCQLYYKEVLFSGDYSHDPEGEVEEPSWLELENRFWIVFGVSSMRIYIEVVSRYSLGATEGNITPYCCIDFDFNTPQFHMFPVGQDEFMNARYQFYASGWYTDQARSNS